MDDQRQKNQLELAWGEEARGEAPKLIPSVPSMFDSLEVKVLYPT